MTKVYLVSGNRGSYRDGTFFRNEEDAIKRSRELVARGLCDSAGYGEWDLENVPKGRRIR